MKERSSFTLVELLITITIIGILAAAVILVINPAQMLDQGRDARRIADLNSLNQAVATYIYQGPGLTGLGSQNTVYVSLPDTTTTCSDLSLPSLPTGWSYHCVTQQNLFNVNGTGWMPINLTQVTGGSPISTLLIDPTNSASGGEYYTYAVSTSSTYELTAYFESNKYQSTAASDGGPNPIAYELGSSLTVTPFLQGLVGYWPLNEGSGSAVYDNSGWGNNGTLKGSTDLPTWTSSNCLDSASCLSFDGKDDYVSCTDGPSLNLTGPLTMSVWVYPTVASGSPDLLYVPSMYVLWIPNSGQTEVRFADTNGNYAQTTNINSLTLNAWNYIVGVFNGTKGTSASEAQIYINGVKQSVSISGTWNPISMTACYIGGTTSFNGMISDAEIYNKALTSYQIQATYNAKEPH
ncbi:MAG: LamG domain-containing protein [Patescibacteria group bacterium]|nr:LamG domain-containing protein [Patescibacteria group bacterium]